MKAEAPRAAGTVGVMPRPHGRLALTLALVLGAATLSLGALPALDGQRVADPAGGPGVRAGPLAVGAAVLPAKIDRTAEHVASARSARHRWLLLTVALAAAVAGIGWPAARRVPHGPVGVPRQLAPARTTSQRGPPGLRLAAS